LQRRQDRPPIGEPVGIHEAAQPGRQVGHGIEPRFPTLIGRGDGHEPPSRRGEVIDRVDRLRSVPVDERHRDSLTIDGVPRAEVAMRDDLAGPRWMRVEAVVGDGRLEPGRRGVQPSQ
jgi:hypothetical protein